jgi:glyoxylase-like metal-dependent hydrolase (beta-lactamase superfamily II)
MTISLPRLLASLALPAATQGAQQQQEISVQLHELAPGLHQVASGVFSSFAITQGDSIVVVDLPDTEARSRAILDTLASRFPRTRVRLVVVSHHHGDHIAGLGFAFAAGIPVVTNAGNARLLQTLDFAAARGSTQERIIRPVRDSLRIGSGPNELRLHAVSNGHSDAMLIGYLPAHRLLTSPDLAEPGPWEIERAALVEHVEALGLRVDRVVPGHARVRPWSDFDLAATRDSATAVLRRAAAALGGTDALRSIVATYSLVWTTRYAIGGGQWPGAPAAPMHLKGTETRDFARWRVDIRGERTAPNDSSPFRIVAGPDGGYEQFFSYVVGYDRDSLVARARELAFAPERVILTALDSRCRLDAPANVRASNRPAIALRCVSSAVGPFRLRVDSATAWPLEVETQRSHRVFERENMITAFTTFRTVVAPGGPVLLPHHVERRVRGALHTVASYSRIEIVPIAAPDSLFVLPERALRTAGPHTVRTQELAPGVLALGSDSLYYTLAVVQDSSIVIIEAAETEHRMRAMRDTLRARFPGRALGPVVVTHHHADHVAGLPALFLDGIGAIAHADNAALVRSIVIAGAEHHPIARASVQPVRDSVVLGAGTSNEIRLYAVELAEAATHLVAWLPRHRILVAADVAEGPPAADFRAWVRRRGFDVQRVATAHAGVKAWPREP